ncbi:FkbM family methyltransferase [Mucilaginibacter antarcticus]|uniref:FkbM family methyltransferase n=1 Tax=Mucilaginibacter antarcticus TaxID=1855725 RepID=A0ABW5XMC7_9SPHI
MNRKDRIKLSFTRNWKLPGKERLAAWLKPSARSYGMLKNNITWLTDEPIAIYTSADNYIEWCILSQGTYEDEIGKLIQISLKPGYIALDIGANIGLQSLRMSLAVGAHGKVLAFEPLQYLQEKFSKNTQLNRVDNVTLFPFALADAAAEEDFKINTNSWNQGTFTLSDKVSGDETQRVVIKVADDLNEVKALDRLDLIKIDVEGFEYNVLRGLNQTLKQHKPRILFEYDENYWLRAGSTMADCYQFLQALNYRFYQVSSVGCTPIANVAEVKSGNIFCLPG